MQKEVCTSFIKRGEFTDEIRASLRMRLSVSHVKHSVIAEYLGVNVSTLHKWYSGITGECKCCHRVDILRFINGELDAELEVLAANTCGRNIGRRVRASMESVLKTMAFCYRRCVACEGKGDVYVNRIAAELDEYTAELAAKMAVKGGDYEKCKAILEISSRMRRRA